MIRFTLLLSLLVGLNTSLLANEPDSAWLFSYATIKNNNHNGLHFAWSRDKISWVPTGNEFGFVKSDYGRWGSQKRMLSPYLLQGPNGDWQCIWALNETVNQFAHAASTNLIDWGRQSYLYLTPNTSFQKPVIRYDDAVKQYLITYAAANKFYQLTTKDFKTYSAAKEVSAPLKDESVTINLPDGRATGQLHRVAWNTVDKLVKNYEVKQYEDGLSKESVSEDSQRFAGLKPIDVSFTVQPQYTKPISDLLLGIFFEDINYAADGGLYAELIQNRDFEYQLADKEGRDKTWTSTHSWSMKGNNSTWIIDSASPVHPNNMHYALLEVKEPGAALVNGGFDGIAVKKGEPYIFSVLAKLPDSKEEKLQVSLVSKSGDVIAQTIINTSSDKWKNYNSVLAPSADAKDAQLEIKPLSKGRIALDMVSLFPQSTFKNRRNGLRSDLAQTIAAIHPRFVRFPGGCVAHGDGLENIYRWKNTIGPVEARKPQRNLWGYHQSAGLGYFEYFQFCEDIGAAPLPVVAAGVPCQNSGTGGGGQQGGIPMDEMDEYVQDVLDLVEYANGAVTSKWGKLRAEAGHPKPFNLKYVGIGNEDLITDVFEQRFTMIFNAMRKAHPEITVIGTVGPFYQGTDYDEGWKIAGNLQVPMVDEHYYEAPGWFINNQDFYDKYDRTKSKVYLGEYASHGNTLYNALAEAMYLTALERNGDVVHMASYAPLLAKEGHTQWNPDLIYFNNSEVKPTVNYEVQKLYGEGSGNSYIPVATTLSNSQENVKKRIGISIVKNATSGDVIVKLVNLLPVATNASVDLQGLNITQQNAVETILTGNPTERIATPVTGTIKVAEKFIAELPAYSFTVIRIKSK